MIAFALKALGWLKLLPSWIYYAIAGIALCVAAVVIHGHLERKAYDAAWNAGWSADHVVYMQTVADYRAAVVEATRIDKANIARVQGEQTAITEKVSNDYENKLADSASRYDRLRAKADGYLSRPSPAGVPETRDTTCQAIAGTDCENIPTLLKAAQDNTDQLIALQAWVTAQSQVDVGNTP